MSDEAAVHAAFDEIEAKLGPATILVLNAGILPLVPLEETSTELWERTLAINLTGGFLVARRALPGMRALGYGRVVGLGAAAGKSGGARIRRVCRVQGGADDAREVDRGRVRPRRHHREHRRPRADRHAAARRHPRGGRPRPGGPPRDGRGGRGAVAFLVSSEAGYITGEVLDINGGTLID